MAALLPDGSLAADVNITGVTDLDRETGTTAEVASGVVVSSGAATSAIAATVGGWTVTNRGSLSTASGIATVSLKFAGSQVINFGSIAGPAGDGIDLYNGGTVDNRSGATINVDSWSGVSIGHRASVPLSVVAGGPGTVINAGTITQTGLSTAYGPDAVVLAFGGSVTNLLGGTITAAMLNASGVSVAHGSVRYVSNAGTIESFGTGYATGVTVQDGATSTVINTSTGHITGTFNGIYSGSDTALTLTNDGTISSTNSYAVDVEGGGTLTNTGTIGSAATTGLLLRGSGTLTNSGTVTGATNAISFSGNTATHTLNLDTGSVLNGNVVGVTNVGATDNLVLLGTGTESAAKFLNFETLSMQGSAWTLSGNATFATSAQVQAGVLTVGGNLASPSFSILSGGTVTGTGTLTGAVANSGTIRVAAGQIFHVAGNTSFNAGSIFAIGVTPSTAGLLEITGTANLGGTVNVLAGAGTYGTSSSYTILTAPTIAGTFAGLTSSSAFLTPSLVYNSTSVVLQLSRNFVSFSSAGNTPNQMATGAALDTLPGTDPLVAPLASLSLADAAAAFDRLSGEAYASTQAALANDSRYVRDAAFDRVDAAFAAIDALKAGRRSIWGQGFGGLGGIAGDGNAAPLGGGTGGLLIGMDGLLPDGAPFSIFGGLSSSRFSIADRGSQIAAQSFYLGASTGREIGGFRLKGGGALGLSGVTIDRSAGFTGFADTTSASYAEAAGQLFAELSYAIEAEGTTLEPFGRVALVGVSGGSYAESGGDAALSGHSNGYGLALATLGLAASTDLALTDDLTIHASGRIGLQQGFGGAPTATNRFAGSDSFTTAGTPAGGTTLLLEAALSTSLSPVTDLSLGFSGAMGTNGSSGALKARLSGAF